MLRGEKNTAGHKMWGQRYRQAMMRWCLVGALAFLSACSAFKWLPIARVLETETIRLEAERGINNDHPLPVDIVFTANEAAIKRLTELKAEDYFNQREQIRRDFPTGLDILRWEIVPGQAIPTQAVPPQAQGALAAFVFAGYLAPGIHRARIDELRHVAILLGPKSFSVFSAS